MKHFLVIAIVAALSACGGGSSGSNDNNNSGAGGGTSNPPPTPNPAQTTVLEGTWFKGCGPIDAAFPEDGYDIVTITVSGDSFSTAIENYTDAACSVAFPSLPTASANGTVTIGSNFTNLDGDTVTELDILTSNSSDPDIFDVAEFDIFLIEGDFIYFGEESGITENERPEFLDREREFLRQ